METEEYEYSTDYDRPFSIYDAPIIGTGLLLNEDDTPEKLNKLILHNEYLKELISTTNKELLNENDSLNIRLLELFIFKVDKEIQLLERLHYQGLLATDLLKQDLKPILLTKYKNNEELETLHTKVVNGKLLKCDLDSWMYWFGGVPTSNPIQIDFLKSIPELLYFIETLCPDDFKIGQRKIKELNQIFKPIKGKKVDSIQYSTTVHGKKSAIDKLFM